MNIKRVEWLGDRGDVGFELWEVQQGKEPSDWKPMPSIGLGVKEIRVRAGKAYRLIYVARYSEAVYVLHAFEKKSRKTSKPDLALARDRFRTLVRERRQK